MAISKLIYLAISVPLLCACNPTEPEKPQQDPKLVEACHYIQGGGSQTVGGSGGATYVVTTLEDAIDPATNKGVAGTLRHAVEQGDARLIIFRVAGTINLVKPLTITKGNLTIAGQSAPGDGICIADYPIIIKNAENIIIRFIRVRLGTKSLEKDKNTDYDALSINNSKNIVIDHCSFSWSVDECVSCYGNENFTLQYCFITESLRNAGHVKGAHGYGGIWGGTNASFHHNLLAHHDSRNPRFDHDFVDNTCYGPIDYVNNMVYNWGGNSTYGGESVNHRRTINMIANYYKHGPSTSPKYRLLNATTYCTNCISSGKVQPGSFYLADNYMYGNPSVTADNWSGVIVDKDGTATVSDCKSSTRHAMTYEITIQSAEDAYETVLVKAGCSLVRDAVDTRIVSDVRNSSGKLIDKPSDVGGYPTYSGTLPLDLDRDGIPDEWEREHGLNPNFYSDSRTQTLVEGYTNLEVYLNSIVAHLY